MDKTTIELIANFMKADYGTRDETLQILLKLHKALNGSKRGRPKTYN